MSDQNPRWPQNYVLTLALFGLVCLMMGSIATIAGMRAQRLMNQPHPIFIAVPDCDPSVRICPGAFR
jgi:hypothetical protein